ncbi:MAG: Lrp/AsnC family transcriptional regulator [Candidatus Bathycorpusculaceae bacterium]
MTRNMVATTMDKTDVVLTMLLLNNSRISYRELAEKLGLSVNAVHKRIQSLIDSGIIRRFTAKISLSALKAVSVIVYGKSEAESVSTLHEVLGSHGSINWAALAGGNYLYILAHLRSISELEPLIAYVKKEAKISSPTVGIITATPINILTNAEATLYPLDREIIYSLRDNSRKALADIAEELGVSAKTVRRRLSNMINKGLIELSMEWYPDASNDIMTIIHIRLKPEVEKKAVFNVLKTYFPNMIFHWSFSNLPNELLSVFWTNTMKELRDIQQRLVNEVTVESIMPNILYTGYIFDTWRDDLLRPKRSGTEKKKS